MAREYGGILGYGEVLSEGVDMGEIEGRRHGQR